MLRAIWASGRLSRSELRERLGLTGNGIGLIADGLMRQGVLRECPPEPGAGAGRPRVPLEIDPVGQHVVGLAIGPGRVQMIRLGFGGMPVSKSHVRTVGDPSKLIDAAAQLLATGMTRQVIGVGVSVTGLVDPVDRAILFSSSQPNARRVSLAPALAAAGDRPVVLENDMHALAARWLLSNGGDRHADRIGDRRADHSDVHGGRDGSAGRPREFLRQDVLLISVADGRLGAAMLVNGRPNRGCVTGSNELGHNRFFVDTERCYCGHPGCLERIVTTDFLHRCDRQNKLELKADRDIAAQDLEHRVAAFETTPTPDRSLDELLRYLSCGIGNAINFVRPHRVVIVNEIADSPAFDSALRRAIQRWLLPELADRVALSIASEPLAGSAESAAWLAIAELLHGGWGRVRGIEREKRRRVRA